MSNNKRGIRVTSHELIQSNRPWPRTLRSYQWFLTPISYLFSETFIIIYQPKINHCAKYKHIPSKYERGVRVTNHNIDFDRFKVYLTTTFTFKVICVCRDGWCNLHTIYTRNVQMYSLCPLWTPSVKQWDMSSRYEPQTGFKYTRP